jgi:hypothetical protein
MMTEVKIKRITSEWKSFAFCSRPCRVFFIGAFVAIIMMMNIIADASTKNLIPLEIKSKSKVDDGFVPPTRNETPSWSYVWEPPSVSHFWKSPNRMFARQLYPLLGKFRSVLEVGARGYNRDCKAMINSTTTKYYQVEPFPPDVMNNDGLLQCKVQEIPTFYPQYESFFDVALDFIFGWKVIRTHFNTTEEILNDVSDYMDGMLFLLKPKALWILRTVGDDWVPDEKVVFDNFILPHFEMGSFEGHASGLKQSQFTYYFLFRKEVD